MPASLTSSQVWQEVEKQIFAVIGTVNPKGEARTAGIVYVVRDRCLYISTGESSWKARHISANPHVSLTVTIPKRIPFWPWFKIPAATITFQGEASIHGPGDTSAEIQKVLMRGLEMDPELVSEICFIEVVPKGRFLTYGVGVSLLGMKDPEKARGTAPV